MSGEGGRKSTRGVIGVRKLIHVILNTLKKLRHLFSSLPLFSALKLLMGGGGGWGDGVALNEKAL